MISKLIINLVPLMILVAPVSLEAEVFFKIGKTSYTDKEIRKDNPSSFYEVEKKKFELIDRIAKEKYLEFYWNRLAKKQGTTAKKAEENYFKSNAKVSDKEVSDTLKMYGDHPQLKKLPKEEQQKQVRDFLMEQKKQQVMREIIDVGVSKKELVIVYSEPEEPVYDVQLTKNDYVRYGPKATDTKPLGCDKNCEITVVEYSEFECPYCEKVTPTIEQVLEKYKGKIRWVMRDYPLPFHKNAKPAAIAAHCAGDQGSYYRMYKLLFANQKQLNPSTYEKHAKKLGLNLAKFKECVNNPTKKLAIIDENMESGSRNGVSGTPAFFVNGRRLSGAIPFPEFDRVIQSELKKKK
jgi:protein-disulfide isomerase